MNVYWLFQYVLRGHYEHLLDFLVDPDGYLSLTVVSICVFLFAVFVNWLYYKVPLFDRPQCAKLYVYFIVMLCVFGITYGATKYFLTNNLNDGLFTIVNVQTGDTDCLVRESEIGWFAIASSLDSVVWFFLMSILGFQKMGTNNRHIPFKIF